MENNLKIYYDEEGDFLEIASGDISNCYFNNLGSGIFEIIDKESNQKKGIAIFNFKARTENLNEIDISLPFKLNIA